jgi:Methyltransferase domain
VIADIAGARAQWLAERGHRVEHRDLIPLHVEQLRADAGNLPQIHTATGDAPDLDLPDASVDAVLLLGPIYRSPPTAIDRRSSPRSCAARG